VTFTCVVFCLPLLGLPVLVHGQDTLAGQIRAAQEAGNYQQTAKLYLQLIAAGTDSPEIRSNCGIMLHLAGKNHEALEQFRIALRRKPDLASANLFAGLSEFDLGQFRDAMPFLERAQELDPTRPAPLLALAKTYVALREYQAANNCYIKAAAKDANLAEAWFGIGVTSRSMADELLNQAVRNGQADDPAFKDKAHHLLDDALRNLTTAIELEPTSARTHLIMGEALADEGKLAEATREYEAAMKLDPALDAAYLGLASAYWKQRQFDEALRLLQHVLAKSPKDPEANGIMADIAEHNGDNSAAEQYANLALAGNPNLIETRVVLARVYLSEHKPDQAVRQLSNITPADPDGSYHFLLYRAYHEAGNETAAQTALAEYKRLKAQRFDR
jgi:tetratricopeptide (TPR) repeat protein